MTRRQLPGPPPGIFSSPATQEALLGWVVPAAATLVAVCAGGLWLAGEASYLTGGSPRPGNPVHYVKSLIDGRSPWPDAWGWAVLSVVAAVAAVGTMIAVHLVTTSFTRRHRADRVARHLAPRADRARLGPQARLRESARLSPNAADWQGARSGR